MDHAEDVKRRLLDGNRMFSRAADACMMAKLAERQEPFVAILACSDSRVDPEKVFNLSLGSAFVVRTAGNCASDACSLGSLEYAVAHLGVKAVVVMGHTGCGAVRASCESCDIENLRAVLSDLDAVKASMDPLEAKDPDKVSENNVRAQVRRLTARSPALGDAVRKGDIAVYGAMFDIRTGEVRFI